MVITKHYKGYAFHIGVHLNVLKQPKRYIIVNKGDPKYFRSNIELMLYLEHARRVIDAKR